MNQNLYNNMCSDIQSNLILMGRSLYNFIYFKYYLFILLGI